ncbi:F-box/kelch-repeat protein [Cardamine amara subsp. amara]|uniref:F-box/kelch-repeat protein n=1 Tax=Cardamine amara subsp. amara TaxID=228776 RepID=A0ABD1AV67_CARAN
MIRKEVKPTQKEKEEKNPHQPLTFSSLPDEIIENILARISKWNYPNLSLVSKRFLSLLTSPELYRTRSNIDTTEPCLYFSLELSKYHSPEWYTLWMNPSKTLTDDDEYSLVPVPCNSHPHPVPYESTVAVGWEIYLIGAPYKSPPSSAVCILDCRNHTWRDGPNMMVARESASAIFLGGKIYVMGGCEKYESMAWMEVLDIKTQTWSSLPSHKGEELRSNPNVSTNDVLEGKIYTMDDTMDYAYDPKKGTWEVVETHSSIDPWMDAWCVIENVMYCYTDSGCCMWYESKSRKWIEVKGLDLETFTWGYAHDMVNYGGKLLVMWLPIFERDNGEPISQRIRCVKIALEKRRGVEVWGKVEWTNTLLTVLESFELLSFVVVSI